MCRRSLHAGRDAVGAAARRDACGFFRRNRIRQRREYAFDFASWPGAPTLWRHDDRGRKKQGKEAAFDVAQEEVHSQAAVTATPAIIWNGTMTEGATTLALLTINGVPVTLAQGESYAGYTVTGMTTRDLTLAGPQGDLHLQPLEAQS